MRKRGVKKPIVDYWHAHYVTDGKNTICSLCGNNGVVDTRNTAVSSAGESVGRLNFCICPNGQLLRYHKEPLDNFLIK
jgi:hypothetical protein